MFLLMITCLGFAVCLQYWFLSLSQPTVSWAWSVRWLPLYVAQNELVRCPEETIKCLSCFKATGLGAGMVMMSGLVLCLFKENASGTRLLSHSFLCVNANVGQFSLSCRLHTDVDVWTWQADLWVVLNLCWRELCLCRFNVQYMCVFLHSCVSPPGLSLCQCYCSVMRSKKQTVTLLALLNKPLAQWGCPRSSRLTPLMMPDMLCVLNISVCVCVCVV